MLLNLKLSKLVHEYTIKGMQADDEFIKNVIEIVKKEIKLEDYITTISLNLNQENYYDFLTSTINISNFKQNEYTMKPTLISDEEQLLHYNLMVLEMILYECERAMQYKICESGVDCCEKELLEISLSPKLYHKHLQQEIDIGLDISTSQNTESIMQSNMDYREISRINNRLGEFLPSNRMANINAIKRINSIFRELGVKNFCYEKEFLRKRLNSSYLKGYRTIGSQIISPTLSYLYTLSCSCGESIFYLANNLEQKNKNKSLNKRLYYGMPITHYELEKVNKKI